ncbi:uncharacterized protein LOC133815330 [Humulus lupulus]|uniref:uncharacterized protein LOC133815330 n=1 Tax=Humulus lupulus TaxID=3486 RepID=UPI002B40BCFB|nr:uncharacterized protein LOC133815330 [Humulus lupulus]
MPNYVKFLKDILTKKMRLGEFEMVVLTEGCSAILKNKIPPKLFTIPISIGEREVGKTHCDLGASINLMPMSTFKKMGIGEARPTTVTLQLTDRSMGGSNHFGETIPCHWRTLIDVEKGDFTIRAQEEQLTFKVFNPIHSPNEVEACLAISAFNSKMIEKMHEKHSKGVRKKVPFEEIEKGGEPWKSKEEELSHPQKLLKKKKHGRKP